MDANVHSAVLSGLAQQLMNVTVPQPLQLTPQASTYRHNLIMSMAAAQLNNTLQQQAFAAVSAAAPAMFQYLPAAASAATESAPAPGFYYQPILTANTAAPNFCTCACFPNTCPVHGYEIASTANAANAANVQAQTNLTSTSLFGSPFRTVVLPQPQVMTGPAPPPTPAAPAPSSFPAALMMQQRLLSVSQAATSNATSHAASEAAANSLRMKRQNAFHNSDGRPAKVRRVMPDTSSTPSSSQPLMDSAPEVYPNLHVDPPAPIIRPARSCASCHNVFSPQHQPSPMCLCHRSLSCEYSQMVCATCFLSVTTSRQPDMIVPRIGNNFESAMNHQQSLARRQADRNLQATQYFYQTNQNYVQLAAAQSAAATAPTASPLMVVNSRPFEFLFFTGDQSQPNVLLTGTAAHNLQQLQQVLTNGPVHEPPPVGATLDQIKKTTSICNYTKDPNVPEQERDRCTVCLCDFETGDEVRALNCSHMFHVDCIDRWLVYNKKCPVCRVEMDKTIDYPTPLGYEDELYATAPTEAATVAAPAAAAS
uniref:RING-type domain-containing protein n=1 Tax=Panagrellus redivivus TaxID=6233 RepID=A0A7E4UW61_PANRE